MHHTICSKHTFCNRCKILPKTVIVLIQIEFGIVIKSLPLNHMTKLIYMRQSENQYDETVRLPKRKIVRHCELFTCIQSRCS